MSHQDSDHHDSDGLINCVIMMDITIIMIIYILT